MNYLEIALKIIVALSIINVWLLRFGKSTPFRGGNAKNMKEEFAEYGLPAWFMGIIGTIKVLLSIALLISIWIPEAENIAALGLAILMLGALGMHLKIGDPFKKSIPAITFLILSLAIFFI